MLAISLSDVCVMRWCSTGCISRFDDERNATYVPAKRNLKIRQYRGEPVGGLSNCVTVSDDRLLSKEWRQVIHRSTDTAIIPCASFTPRDGLKSRHEPLSFGAGYVDPDVGAAGLSKTGIKP